MAKQELSNLFVRITADTRQFTGAIDRTQQRLGAMTRSVGALASTFGVAFGAYGAVRFIKSSTAAFAEQEKAVEGLRATLELTGRAGGGALDRLTDKAAALQRVTTAADEALIGATASLGQLATGLDTTELEQAQEAIIGIADVFLKGDVNNAAILLGKTIGSTTNALTRYGIQVDSAASQSEKLRQVVEQSQIFFDAAQAKANTLDGRLKQLSNAYGDLKEQVGDIVVQLLGFNKGADGAKSTIVQLTTAIEENKQQIVEWGKATVGVVADLTKLAAIVVSLKAAIGIVRAIAAAFGVLGIAIAGIPAALVGLTAALTGGAALYVRFKQRVDDAREAMQQFRREADRRVAFRVGLPDNIDQLRDLRDNVTRELGRIGADLEGFRRQLGDEQFQIALQADLDGPFSEVRKLADEALALQERLLDVNLAIRALGDTGGATDGVTAQSAALSDLAKRTRKYRAELAAIPLRVDAFDQSDSIQATTSALRQQQSATRAYIDDLITASTELPDKIADAQRELQTLRFDPEPNEKAIAETSARLEDLRRDAERLQPILAAARAKYDEQTAALRRAESALAAYQQAQLNFRAGIDSVLPSLDELQRRMAAMATATAQAAIALATLDFRRLYDALTAGFAAGGAGPAREVELLFTRLEAIGEQAIPRFVNLGVRLMSGMGNGFSIAKSIVLNILEQVLNELVAYALKKLRIFSPSRLTMEWGENLMLGLAYGLRDNTTQLERQWQDALAVIRAPADMTLPPLTPLDQPIDLRYGDTPRAPSFDALTQRIALFYGRVPDLPRLAAAQQRIELSYDNLPQLPALEPLTQTIELAYGAIPTTPELEKVTATTVADATQLDPVVNIYVDSLFADPQAEARKIGSQVFLREGYTVARESGFDG